MKDIITIVVRLTISCLLAATVMGIFFIFTNNAKKHNEHLKEQQVRYQLLGFEDNAHVPGTMAMHEIYRFVISGGDSQSIGYLVPGENGPEGGVKGGFLFVNIDLDGKLIISSSTGLNREETPDEDALLAAVQQAAGSQFSVKFADRTVVVTDNGNRVAYLLGGRFQGFKTFIKVMLAVDPQFSLLGLEILEHEEDPGLGGEIEQDYFKNQFKGKPFAALKSIDVQKAPLPEDYLQALNGRLGEEEILRFREQYRDRDIYALTGATISTRAVCNGVKGIVTRFAYRVGVLDTILREQQLAVPF